ncbi:MAG TPA: hypothetical protein VIT45_18390 [Allosphingosinicella sp.]
MYAAIAFAFVSIVLGAIILIRIPPAADAESRKVRLAAAMFAGIMLIFIFVALISVAVGAGGEVFDTAVKAMLPLAGAIAGYFFGTGQRELPTNVKVASAPQQGA